MGKKARQRKERKANPTDQATEGVVQAASGPSWLRPVLLYGTPLATIVIALLCWFVLDSKTGTGVTAMVGIIASLGIYSTNLGDEIPASGRSSAGSIDFGTRS